MAEPNENRSTKSGKSKTSSLPSKRSTVLPLRTPLVCIGRSVPVFVALPPVPLLTQAPTELPLSGSPVAPSPAPSMSEPSSQTTRFGKSDGSVAASAVSLTAIARVDGKPKVI